jgi:hypothetical protein
MQHLQAITHLNQPYELGHLAQHFGRFSWISEDRIELSFSVRVRYSTHCYSEDLKEPCPAGGCVITDESGRDRLFCPIRHAHSISLPDVIGGLFTKPGTSVKLTYERDNWSIFRLQMTPPLAAGHKYFAFFRVKPEDPTQDGDGAYRLDLYVESAYQRAQPVAVRSSFPFGKVAERVARGLRL